MNVMPGPGLSERVGAAVTSGAEALLTRQNEDGVFVPGGDRFSPANTAAALIALHHAAPDGAGGPADPDGVIARGVMRLCASQRADGGWAMAGVPTELLTTAVVTAALRLTAPDEAASAVRAGTALITRLGGPETLPEPTMTRLVAQFDALGGAGDAAALPRLPLELLLLRGPARRLLSLRLPIFASTALGQAAHRPQGPVRARLNAMLRPAALGIVREAYEREGATGEFSTDPWLTSLISLGITRSGLAPDISRASARRLRAMARPDGSWDLMPLDVTWSAFAVSALLEAGYAADERLEPTRAMFHARQAAEPFAALGCPAGYWGFSSAASWPMSLETAEVSSALLRLPGGAHDEHARRGTEWLTRMQDSAGSWSLAVRDSRPGGFGPCPHLTAKAVRTLLDAGVPPADRRVTRALRWLARKQRADGSFEVQWYRGPVPGTAVVLETLCRAGSGGGPAARRARELLLRTQRADGSWSAGRDDEPEGTAGAGGTEVPGAGGTVEETSWALHALLTAGADPYGDEVAAAARWLAGTQCGDGSWQGAPVNEYVRGCLRYADDAIASGLAVRALARLRSAMSGNGAAPGAVSGAAPGTAPGPLPGAAPAGKEAHE